MSQQDLQVCYFKTWKKEALTSGHSAKLCDTPDAARSPEKQDIDKFGKLYSERKSCRQKWLA